MLDAPTVHTIPIVQSRSAPMKTWLPLTAALTFQGAVAQLPNGSTAPDFTLTDYYGTTHRLYDYLDSGKTVFVEIFAAHCPTCWAYHQTQRLKTLYNQYGPDGTDELMVLALEYDQWNGANEFIGIGPPWVTAGDWLTGTPYPIFNVEDPDRGVFSDYNVTFYPAIYRVCPDRIVERVFTSHTEAQLVQMVQDCQVAQTIAEPEAPHMLRYDPGARSLIIDAYTSVLGLDVLDVQGRVVLSTGTLTQATVDLSRLVPGVFLFRVRVDSGFSTTRLYVE